MGDSLAAVTASWAWATRSSAATAGRDGRLVCRRVAGHGPHGRRPSLAVSTTRARSSTTGSSSASGYNDSGQLGQGDTATAATANEMGDLLPACRWARAAPPSPSPAAAYHTCVLLDDGQLKCWGANSYGQLGQGDTKTAATGRARWATTLPAVSLGTGRTAVAIACGGHTCVILDDGSAQVLGDNGNGQLGLGDTNNRGDEPGEMGDSLPAVSLGTGRTAVGLMLGQQPLVRAPRQRAAQVLGWNNYGQLGLGDVATAATTPTRWATTCPPPASSRSAPPAPRASTTPTDRRPAWRAAPTRATRPRRSRRRARRAPRAASPTSRARRRAPCVPRARRARPWPPRRRPRACRARWARSRRRPAARAARRARRARSRTPRACRRACCARPARAAAPRTRRRRRRACRARRGVRVVGGVGGLLAVSGGLVRELHGPGVVRQLSSGVVQQRHGRHVVVGVRAVSRGPLRADGVVCSACPAGKFGNASGCFDVLGGLVPGPGGPDELRGVRRGQVRHGRGRVVVVVVRGVPRRAHDDARHGRVVVVVMLLRGALRAVGRLVRVRGGLRAGGVVVPGVRGRHLRGVGVVVAVLAVLVAGPARRVVACVGSGGRHVVRVRRGLLRHRHRRSHRQHQQQPACSAPRAWRAWSAPARARRWRAWPCRRASGGRRRRPRACGRAPARRRARPATPRATRAAARATRARCAPCARRAGRRRRRRRRARVLGRRRLVARRRGWRCRWRARRWRCWRCWAGAGRALLARLRGAAVALLFHPSVRVR
jgi:hypothetical protein